jgi:hypothetical protein
MVRVSLRDRLLWPLVLLVTLVFAVPRNVRVDDEFGDEVRTLVFYRCLRELKSSVLPADDGQPTNLLF